MTEECVLRLDRLRRASFSTTLHQQQQRAMVDEIFKACNIETEKKTDMVID